MFERVTGTLLVAAGETAVDAAAETVRYCLMAGRRVVRRGEVAPGRLAELGGYDIRASFFDRGGYFGRVASQTANARLAGVVARRFIDGEMLFNEPYRLRLSATPTGEHDFQLRMVAASELACVRLEDLLPLQDRPVSTAALEEVAIAALVARVTMTQVMVAFARGSRFMAFLAEGGEVKSRSVEALYSDDPAAAIDAANRAEAMLLGGNSALGGGSSTPPLKIYLGDLRSLAAEPAALRDVASREIEKRIAALVQGGDALLEPELYGLKYVAYRWNLLEPEQAQRAWAWKIAVPTVGAMLATTVAFAGLATLLHMGNRYTEKANALQQSELDAQRGKLVARVPPEQDVRRIKDLTDLLRQRDQQVRVDHLLSWLTHQVPQGASVAALHVFPVGETPPEVVRPKAEGMGGVDLLSRLFMKDDAATPQAQALPQPAATLPVRGAKAKEGEYELTVDLVLPGTYERGESLAAEIIRRLAAKGSFKLGTLTYDAEQNRSVLHTQMTVLAEDFIK